MLSNKLGLGTVQFGMPYGISNAGGQTPASQVSKILEVAEAHHITILDSAAAYGNAEEVLGQNDLQEFNVVSKFLPPSMAKAVELQFEESLKKLRLPSLYGYLAHRSMELLNSPNDWRTLQKLKAKGKVKKIGFSLNEPEELEELQRKDFFPDIVQVPFNYFDNRFENSLLRLKENGCEIHTRSSFLQGLFFVKPDHLNSYFHEIKATLMVLQESKASLPGRLLKFVVEKPFIDKVIIGVENEQQLLQNLKDLETAAELPKLQKTISEKVLIPSLWPKN